MASLDQIKSAIKKIVSKDFGKKAPPSILIMGPPGRGKTLTTEEIAKDLGAEYKVFMTATMDPTDVVGCPQPVGNVTRFLPPEDLYSLTVESGNTWPAVVCFDDMPAANDQVFAALFRLFQQREVGVFKLRNNVLIIATGNNATDKSAAKELPLALANRCIRFDIDAVKTDEWLAWALQNGVTSEIYGFISTNPDQLDQFERAKTGTETSFATPRSVTIASRIQEIMGLEDPNLFIALRGACGEGWAVAFKGYLKNHAMLIPPKEILDNPLTARIPAKEQIDITFATIAALVYEVNRTKKVEHAKAAIVYANRLVHKEHTTQICRVIVSEIGGKDKGILNILSDQSIRDIFQKNHEYLTIPYSL